MSQSGLGIVGFLIGVVFVLILLILIIAAITYAKRNSFGIDYQEVLDRYCENLGPIEYREEVYIPENPSISLLVVSKNLKPPSSPSNALGRGCPTIFPISSK